MTQKRVVLPSPGDVATSSRLGQSDGSRSRGLFGSAVEGFSAVYALAAKFAVQGLERLADRGAERRAERLAQAPAHGVATGNTSSRLFSARRASTQISASKAEAGL
jgi:hypothetical protein